MWTRPAALNTIVKTAVACERKTQVPAEILVAQCALESGWLKHAPGNNCFGIKYYPGAFGSQKLWTIEERNGQLVHEQALFATFPTLQACFEKRAELFTAGRYKPCSEAWKQHKDLERLIDCFALIYATDHTYASKVKAFVHDPEIKKALAAERAATA